MGGHQRNQHVLGEVLRLHRCRCKFENLIANPDVDNLQAVHLMPTQANAYVLVLTTGKTFSNLPEHTWPDYAKMADKLPSFVQQMAPLPPMHASRVMHAPPQISTQVYQPQPQSQPPPQPPGYLQSQRQQPGNCCPSHASRMGAPHTCCPPGPMTRPWPMPPINAPGAT